jgi:hypothetical protein
MSVLVSRPRAVIEIEIVARDAGMHPALVERLMRAGLADLEPPDAAARLARTARMRRDLGLNFAGAVLACELLARIDDLQDRLRRYER